MDAVMLSRIQTGLSLGVHFLFPALTLGLTFVILVLEFLHWRTGEEHWRDASSFAIKILGLVFAFGVATGITLPIAFGTNWAEFSKVTGAIFGTNLAVEAVVAFTLESVFLGILLFGRKKVSKGLYLTSALMVFIGSHLSGFIIIATNSWMQTPFHDPAVAAMANPVADAVRDGFTVVNGKFVLHDFFTVFFNPTTIIRFLHTTTACWMTGSVFLLGIAAWYLLKQVDVEKALRLFRVAGTIAFSAALLQPVLGHSQIMKVSEYQPQKSAAMEGIFKTVNGATLYSFGWVDVENQRVIGFGIPGALSFLESGSFTSPKKGLNEFPKSEWPPVQVIFQTFHLKVMIGITLIGLTALALFWYWKRKLAEKRWLLKALVWSIPLPIIAVELGWMTAEIGRQPWTVWKLLSTSRAASQVPVEYVWFSLIALAVVYALLLFLFFRFLPGLVRSGIK